MKKLLFTILALTTLTVQAQTCYVSVPTHYDSKTTANDIIKGRVENHLSDSVRFVTEKKRGRYVIKKDMSPSYVKKKLDKTFMLGDLEYVSRTNGGYTFTVAVVNIHDDTKVINYCVFKVNAYSGKITEVEILKGE